MLGSAMSDRIFVRVQQRDYNNGLSMAIIEQDGSGARTGYASSIEMKASSDHEFVEGAVILSHKAAQVLMDDLYACGVRPTDAKVGDAHLSDVRQIMYAALRKIGLELK